MDPQDMSTGPVRRVSRQDIQLVQNLIERCLQLYMNQKEVVDTLLAQAKIEPGFTELVWKKLEEENREFFKAYYLRLMVKHQISEFNKLLEQQVQLMHGMQNPPRGAPMSTSNGSHIPQLHQNTACYASLPEHAGPLKPGNLHHAVNSSMPNAYTNGGSLHTTMHTAIDMATAHTGHIDAHPSILSTQNSNMGMMQGMNGGLIKSEDIKSETGFSGSSAYMFGSDGNVLDARQSIGDAAVTPFNNVESSSHPLNESLLESDTPFGMLNQIPRNFSLSDLAADFSQSSDILDSYPRSPFLDTNNESFLDSREREYQDDKRLDTISEGLSYEDFGSE